MSNPLWKVILLTILLTLIGEHMPFRLMALAAEVPFVHQGVTRVRSGNEDYWKVQDLQGKLERMGWTVEYKDLSMFEAYGATNFMEREIYIEQTLTWNGRFDTLSHEGGHTLQPLNLSTAEAEVFAESVSTLVSRDGLREHARYLAALRFMAIPFIVAEWSNIERAADILEN